MPRFGLTVRLASLSATLFAAGCADLPPTLGEAPPFLITQGRFTAEIDYYLGMVRSVPSAEGCVALTFDDGPHRTLTPRLLDILAEENAVATFFVVGPNVVREPEIVAAIAAAGHEIGNHSWNHHIYTGFSSAEILADLARNDEAIEHATGRRPDLIRLPYGDVNERVLDALDRPAIFWNADGLDWQVANSNDVIRSAVRTVHSGSIVVLHDIHSIAVNAVPGIISTLRERGYEFVTVSRLLAGRPCR